MPKLNPVGPISPGLGQIFSDLRRRSLEQAVRIDAHGLPTDGRGTVVVSNHAGELDAEVLRRVWPSQLATMGRGWAIRRGAAVLVFPERGISPDGRLGAFHPEEFDDVVEASAKGSPVTVTPVAVSGTHGVGRQLPWGRGEAERARIVVRIGEAIDPRGKTAEELARVCREAVAALLAEDVSTWWDAARGRAEAPSGEPRWREAWRQRGDSSRPGERAPRRIWGDHAGK